MRVYCDCGKMFEATRAQVGGIVNCPGCDQSVDVPGLNDPVWRAIQCAAVVGILAVTLLVTSFSNVPTGIFCGLGFGLLMWLISRAF
ncbi:MAG: hypothetical protein HRU14_02170 [Planctomycetes bacterium]|nr:hypothetical protein [Planctomycetota bacterium]